MSKRQFIGDGDQFSGCSCVCLDLLALLVGSKAVLLSGLAMDKFHVVNFEV